MVETLMAPQVQALPFSPRSGLGRGLKAECRDDQVRYRRNFAVQPDCVERPFSAVKAVIHCVGTRTLVAIGAGHAMGSPFALIWAARRARFMQ